MLKLYKFSKWYWFIFIALLLISLVIFLYYFYWLKFHNKVAIKIEVDDYKKLSFTINSDLLYKIKKDAYVILSYKKQDFYLKIKQINNISNDIFQVNLFFSSKLNFLKPKTSYNAFLVLKEVNNFVYLFS
ncbi:MAG1140 family protein [Mesomycoplasma hyorhinis]|uniref:Uncharacterized protein n=11 Tax=Mesomycoplasma hyorhinis TaxID=2100 RepID=A0ABM5M4T7_MESHM|nr:hypothetical protein [Mesomycoplasma hyorhinis]AEC45639.1 hypothetical protein SRH_00350 [Mesomycoplasma hyorhinis MCLD]AEX14051.1 hypothetical protein MYM_0270 [Mesomycoplasma hyorhinis GDL-1]AHA41041.1 hypothetical protein Q453_0299 [Mesomycoplasma hyorhinis DBS 1050]AOD25277.1 hypothetical protein MHMDBK_00322 [Mesomycoplasma hyorhinis]MXR06388.1 hypothetical protein [Mesomycoplasma hyorhinis]